MPSRAEESRHLDGELAVWRRPARSLPTRISFFVLAATLLTSLTVTGISVRSIDAFLREKIEQKFPSILANSSEKLDLWYEQRILDIGVFSTSSIVKQNIDDLYAGSAPRQAEIAAGELSQYLSYVLGSFPQYRALFLMSPEGEIPLWIGEQIELPRSMRERIADPSAVNVSGVWISGDERIQVASAAIENRGGGGGGGSLHALLSLDELDRILLSQSLASSGRVFLVGREGQYLASTGGEIRGRTYGRALPGPGAPVVSDYTKPSGEKVVSSAVRFPRFGWTVVVEEPYSDAFAPVMSTIRRTLGINLAIVGALSLIAFRVSVNMVRPIEALSQAVRRITEGRTDVEIPEVKSRDEVGVLTGAFREMTERLAANARDLEQSHSEVEAANESLLTKNEELKCMNEILEQLSITDGLTRLHNHRFFQDYLAKETKRADRNGKPLALILIDIDHFKQWNDRLGHAGGDEILRRIADIMNAFIRESDLLARYGGEEFALVAPDTDLEGAVQLAEKMRSEVSTTRFMIDPPSEHQPVTVSIGIAVYHGDRKALFSEADRALYRAKAAGRDCVMVAELDEAPPEKPPAARRKRAGRKKAARKKS